MSRFLRLRLRQPDNMAILENVNIARKEIVIMSEKKAGSNGTTKQDLEKLAKDLGVQNELKPVRLHETFTSDRKVK